MLALEIKHLIICKLRLRLAVCRITCLCAVYLASIFIGSRAGGLAETANTVFGEDINQLQNGDKGQSDS